jgi:hypothetical protein
MGQPSQRDPVIDVQEDVAALYRMGLHPVLLNGYCRAIGYERSDYRAILAAQAVPETRTGRRHKQPA